MEFMSTLTAKGQTTLPREVRRKLGLGPRQRIVYVVDETGVRIKSAGSGLAQMAGVLSGEKPALEKDQERVVYRKARSDRYSV
jgi:bifunctional DNA-binding transcriptional regulator/antitoxin component of YhaV-PrlF toxin-antitoxin module